MGYAGVGACVGADPYYTTTATILVLFILLVIITRVVGV
jgi:uncharacterized protein (TIGR01732 family)